MLTLQEPWVTETLPHESAETSNTDSNLTDGVLYGFFAPACSGAFSSEVLSLFNCPPKIQFRDCLVRRGCPRCPPAPVASSTNYPNTNLGGVNLLMSASLWESLLTSYPPGEVDVYE
jgi:hypothetical protein